METEVAHDAATKEPLWVIEGRLDLPIHFDAPNGKKVVGFQIGFGAGVDGFTQFRAVDPARVSQSTFVSSSTPAVFEFRVGTRARDSAHAYMRGRELVEQIVDRLTLFSGFPVRLLSIGIVYNEDQLRECVAGARTEYEATTGGELGFRTGPCKNAHLPQLLLPPPKIVHSMRWFRIAMTSARPVDQFVCYYIALEGLLEHIPGVPSPHDDSAAIELLLRRRSLPIKARRRLYEIRSRLMHGDPDPKFVALAEANLPAVQRLTVDAFALILGVDPNQIAILQPFVGPILPIMHATYEPASNPATPWGGLLSDAEAIARARIGERGDDERSEAAHLDALLDEALAATFPASDPVALQA